MSASQLIRDGWFGEHTALWPGQRMCLQVKEVLHEERTAFQDLLVFDSTDYGRVLVLDGVIQLTERDEFAYQEMLAHIPLFTHRAPKSVLIVGGGDGGILREVVKHEGVERIVMCEIDKGVVDAAKKYFATSTATAFEDPRVTLIICDAAEYIRNHRDAFDVILVDSSDPVGPAEVLFEKAFYRDMHAALKPNGIVCTQVRCRAAAAAATQDPALNAARASRASACGCTWTSSSESSPRRATTTR